MHPDWLYPAREAVGRHCQRHLLETYCGVPQPFWKTQRSPFWYLKPSLEIIRLAVMLFVRHSLSLPNVEDLLHEPGIKICPETVRFWWNRFGLCSSVLISTEK